MTVANRLTLARIILAGVFFHFVLTAEPWHRLAAILLFGAASLTDWLDGLIARRTGTTSTFGKVADPLADKLLVIAALVAFLKMRDLDIPAWVIFLTIARELIIVTLRSLAALKGRLLSAERWGKWKMGIQTGSILAILILAALRTVPLTDFSPGRAAEWARWMEILDPFPRYFSYLILVATWASGLWYLYRNRRLLEESWE